MTEREQRNEEMKAKIRRNAEDVCHYIDLMEMELKQRERMTQDLAEALDHKRQLQTV